MYIEVNKNLEWKGLFLATIQLVDHGTECFITTEDTEGCHYDCHQFLKLKQHDHLSV